MMQVFKHLKKIGLSFFIAIVLFVSQSSIVFATSSSDSTEVSAADATDQSFYSVTTALTTYANDVISFNGGDKSSDDSGASGSMNNNGKLAMFNGGNVQPGDAGAVVGYADWDADFAGGIYSNQTHAVTVSSYDAYTDLNDAGNTFAYVRYGRLLAELGLDDTGNSASTGGIRNFGGLFVQGCHLLGSFTPAIFDLAFQFLDFLNPFRFLVNESYDTNSIQGVVSSYAQSGSGSTEGNGTGVLDKDNDNVAYSVANPFSDNSTQEPYYYETDEGTVNEDLKEAVGEPNGLFNSFNNSNTSNSGIAGNSSSSETGQDLYNQITFVTTLIYVFFQQMGIYIILPLLAAFMLCSILIKPRNKYAGTRAATIWTFCKRFLFIIIGVPLLGILYTGFLDTIENEFTSASPSSNLIATTFVDFENWAVERRLDLPNSYSITSIGDSSHQGGTPSTESYRQVRSLIFEINTDVGVHGITGASKHAAEENDTLWLYGGAFDTFADDTNDSSSLFTGMNDLLATYSSGSYYTAAAWESNVQAAFTKYHANYLGNTPSTEESSANKKTIKQMFDDTNEADDWLNREVADNRAIFAGTSGNEEADWAGYSWNIFSNGGLKADGIDGELSLNTNITYNGTGTNWYREGSSNYGTAANPSNGSSHKNEDSSANGNDMGLSTISMYNYLSTVFEDGGINVYSAINTTSEYTRQEHYSVNIAGNGMMSTLYMLNVIACLCVFVILGLVYCIGMVVSNVRKGISMLIQIPFALFGVLRSIAQVIVYVVSMLIEICISVFLFEFAMEFIVMIATMIEGPLIRALNGLSTTVIGGLAGTVLSGSTIEILADTPISFFIGFGVVCVILGIVLFASVKLNRGILVAWSYLWIKINRYLTFEEMLPYYDVWVANLDSLYIWDMKVGFKKERKGLSDVVLKLSDGDITC